LAKKEAEKPKRELTKRQLSRGQQQKKRQRIILGSGILVIVAVLSIVGAGFYNRWYIPEYKPLHQTVIKVNDTKFNMNYYIKMLKYYGSGMSVQQMYSLVDDVVTAIERDELIRQEAMALGITVSDKEVDEELKSYDSQLSKDYRDVVRTQMLVNRLSDEYFDQPQQVPVFAEQRHILAMFLESESQANEVRAKLEAGEKGFAELASELSLDSICKAKEGDLGWRPEGVLSLLIGSSILEENAFSCEVGVLSQPILDETKAKMVGYWLIEVESRDEEATEASVKVMLLGSEQEANEVRARLEAGEDFATLAEKFSQHADSKDEGGEFEVTAKGMYGAAFDEFVFSSELSVLSQPIPDDTVSTEGGYWLIKVTQVADNMEIEKDDRDLLKADALNKWVEGLFDDPKNKVVSYLDDAKKQWAILYIIGG